MKHIATIIFAALITLEATGQCFNTLDEFENYFKNNKEKLDPIEGIWIQTLDSSFLSKADSGIITVRMFIIKDKKHFVICHLPIADNRSFQINNEKLTRKKKEGHYLYSKYSYFKGKNQTQLNSSSITGEAILTNNKLLSIIVEKRTRTSQVPNSNSPGVYKEERHNYIKLDAAIQ